MEYKDRYCFRDSKGEWLCALWADAVKHLVKHDEVATAKALIENGLTFKPKDLK